MTSVSRTFTVPAAPADVLDYLEDFARTEEWDPGTVRTTRTDGEGPIAVGAVWRNVSKILGREVELDYTLTERTADRVVFVGENIKGSATTSDVIIVKPDGTGSRIEYTAHVELHGISKVGTPAMKPMFNKLGDEVVENLTAVFND